MYLPNIVDNECNFLFFLKFIKPFRSKFKYYLLFQAILVFIFNFVYSVGFHLFLQLL